MSARPSRRSFLAAGAATAVATAMGRNAYALADRSMQTFTYKQVGKLAIKADVYRTGDDEPRPVVVWLHGGALINGQRTSIDQRVQRWAIDSGYVLVSLDYRLAPETQLPAIIQDLEDAFAWIHRDGARLFHADPGKLAVAGGSAGGYLTLTAGFRVAPRPSCLLSLWGYGDLVGDWYSKPSSHPRHHRSKLTREQAYAEVSGPPIADARDRPGNGGAFYQYCRQQGSWPQAVTGWDPHREPEKFHPYMAVKHVTADYPPTCLIHGQLDTDVPHEQSAMMVRELVRHRRPHAFHSLPGGEHGLTGADPEAIETAYAAAFAFCDRHLQTA